MRSLVRTRAFNRVPWPCLGLLFVLLAACHPPEQQVNADASNVLATLAETGATISILDAGPGEGDSATVYMVVQFSVAAAQDIQPGPGPFQGFHMNAGETHYGGELQLMYQTVAGGEWMLQSSDVTKMPSHEGC